MTGAAVYIRTIGSDQFYRLPVLSIANQKVTDAIGLNGARSAHSEVVLRCILNAEIHAFMSEAEVDGVMLQIGVSLDAWRRTFACQVVGCMHELGIDGYAAEYSLLQVGEAKTWRREWIEE